MDDFDWMLALRSEPIESVGWMAYRDWLEESNRLNDAACIAARGESSPIVQRIRSAAVANTRISVRVTDIPKKSGGTRSIYSPDAASMTALRSAAVTVTAIGERHLSDSVHGFRPGRSPVTAADAHIGYQWTLAGDLRDHFDRITRSHLTPWMPSDLVDICLYDGATRQGLPTSPAASNLGTIPLDRAIQDRWPGVVYTRYADDMTFSSDSRESLDEIRAELPAIATALGHEVHGGKWRLMGARYGRRVVVGVSVGEGDINAPRSTKRRLRAMQHSSPRSLDTRGLAAWVDYVGGA